MKRGEAGRNAINENQLKAEFADDIDYDSELNKSENREIAKAAHYTRYTDPCQRASFYEFQYEEYLKEIDDNKKEDEMNLRHEYIIVVHEHLQEHPVVEGVTRASKCIPAAYDNLEKVLDNSQLRLDPELLRHYIVKSYKKYWTDSTISGYLPPENKNPVKQKAGWASARKRAQNAKDGVLAVRTDLSVTQQKPKPTQYCRGCDKEIRDGRSRKCHNVACRMAYYRRRKKHMAF